MSNKKLTILGVVAAVMVVLAITVSNMANKPVKSVVAEGNLLQGLDPAVIGTIVLRDKEGNVITLARQGRVFVVLEKDKYPAKTAQINNLITSCLDIKTVELITSDKANFADMGVSDDKPEKSVTFFMPDKSPITGILMGQPAKDVPSGRYVRLMSSNNVYLTTNEPPLFSDAMDYIDRMPFSFKWEDIQVVRSDGPSGSSIMITGQANGGPLLNDVPAGKLPKLGKVADIFSALANLNVDNVMKDPGNLKFENIYTCQLKDSTLYTLHLAPKGRKAYAKLTAEFLDTSDVIKKSTFESKAELKAKEAKLLARDRALEFTRRHQGWVYELPEKNATDMVTKFTDLIEDEPPKPPDKGTVKQ